MKRLMFIIALSLATSPTMSQSTGLTEALQRGLFEEEANRNFGGAAQGYESIIKKADEDRKIIATAMFRLAECYRKLGRTNDARTQYDRLARQFPEQEELVKLARSFVGNSAGTIPGDSREQSELVRELKRRIAEKRADVVQQRAELERMRKLGVEGVLHTEPGMSDVPLNELQQQLRAADQKLASLTTTFGDNHPEVKAVQATRQTMDKQIRDRIVALKAAVANRAQAAEAQLGALELELKKAKERSTQSAANPEQTRLLREEIRLVEQQLASAESRRKTGVASFNDVLQPKKELLVLKRQLPENASPERQKTLIQEQISLVKQLLAERQSAIKAGVISKEEAIPPQRELMALERELAAVNDAQSASAKP